MHTQLPHLNSLKVFDSAARLRSFKKAAKELNVTPTAVSHQIKALEEALGTLLFERKTRAVQLTQDGELLAETTHNVFQLLANVVNEISSTKNIITVSTTSSFAAMWLVPNLDKFYKSHPEIEVAIKTNEQVDDIEKDRRIDLVIRYGIYDDSIKNSIKLITESVGMYSTPSYVLNRDASTDINLLETKWKNENLPEISWNLLLSNKVHKNKIFNIRQFDQEHHVIQAALAGQGVALISSLLVKNALNQGWLQDYKIAEIDQEIKGFSYYLLVPERNIRNKSILEFKDWITNEIR
ncbi:MAG: LysR family transcriptional regulator [Moritella sp.]|uniref:LysR family transcriptional regulator n=1 Tax=Moritella sp. TaxID=78556 RepID=UPI0025EF5984|nr:LysR family transcriptional regulator [Moritella sp.]NQZ90811.1 LysR family transcriptional regulator [Moritella sp.]